MKKTIKLCDYVAVIVDGEVNRLSNNPRDLWAFLNWDIDNDPDAKECAEIVTRELFCFGSVDLSPLTHGKHEVIVKFCFD